MAADVRLLEKGTGTYYGEVAGIWLMILWRKPTVEDMRLARPALKEMTRLVPGGFPTLTWVMPEAGFAMEDGARAAAVEVAKQFRTQIVAQATLIEGEGFQTAAIRAIVAGMDFLSGNTCPKKTFADVPTSVSWCLGKRPTREPLDLAAVSAVVAATGASAKRP